MRILLTNDDGYNSEGLHAVADLFKDKHEVIVIAPSEQRSGASHTITLDRPLKVKKIDGYDYDVYCVDGTPVDCVKIGDCVLFPQPDLVISGINRGENLGSDIWYSGTVSAAAEAAFLGFRALALSCDNKKASYADYVRCAKFIADNLSELTSVSLPHSGFLNINFPKGVVRGVKIVKMNTQKTYFAEYTLDGEVYIVGGARDYNELNEDSDEYLCLNGYITITPLKADRTDYTVLDKIADKRFKL